MEKKIKRYEDHLFLEFLLWVTIPLIIMGCVSYAIYAKGESEKSKLLLESYSSQVTENFDNAFTSIREYYLEMTQTDNFKWLVQQKEPPYHDFIMLRQMQNMLQGNHYMSRYVQTYNLINLKEGWVMNNYGTMPYQKLKNRKEVDDFVEEQKNDASFLYWKNRENIQSPYQDLIGNGFLEVSGKFLILKNYNKQGDIDYILGLQLNLSELESLGCSYKNLGYDMTVIDDESVFMQTNPDMTDALLRVSDQKSGLYMSSAGCKYNINIGETTSNSLKYAIGYNVKRGQKYGIIFLIVAFVIIPLYGGLLLSLKYVSKAFAKPVLSLQKFTAEQNIQIKELLITNLLKGEWNERYILENLRKYNLSQWNHYRLLIAKCKTRKDNDSQSDIDEKVWKSLPKEICEQIFISPVIYEGLLVMIIGESDLINLDNKTAYIYKYLKDYIFEVFNYKIATGISRSYQKLSYTSKAYCECLEVLYNRHKEESDSTLALYDDYLMVDIKNNVYEQEIEEDLYEAVEDCNLEESKRLLSLILKRLEHMELYGIERNFYLNHLVMEIMSIPVKKSIALSDIYDDEQYNVMNLAGRIFDIKELRGYIEDKILIPVIDAMKEYHQSKETNIMKLVAKMVRERRGNITLSECAEILNYNASYLSRILKQERGLTFMDMVNGEKLKLAKDMLMNSERSVAEIAERLQYNNVQNFIRFFKNQEGVTPARFRKDMRSGQQHDNF